MNTSDRIELMLYRWKYGPNCELDIHEITESITDLFRPKTAQDTVGAGSTYIAARTGVAPSSGDVTPDLLTAVADWLDGRYTSVTPNLLRVIAGGLQEALAKGYTMSAVEVQASLRDDLPLAAHLHARVLECLRTRFDMKDSDLFQRNATVRYSAAIDTLLWAIEQELKDT